MFEAVLRAKWKNMLAASKDEALLAVDLYNQAKRPRRLEGFLVHMHLAWLYLIHASYLKDGKDFRYRKDNGWFVKIDGEPKTWELARCVQEEWGEQDPVRKNLELTIGLRNKIEHRYEEATAIATAGHCQALLLNYDAEVVRRFGAAESIGGSLRFPVFVGTFSREGAAQLAASQLRVPARTRRFLADFQGALAPEVAGDQRFEFRVQIVPKLSPKGEADLSLTFVREDELTEAQAVALNELGASGTVVVREQLREVANLELMKPSVAVAYIDSRSKFRFHMTHFARAWKKLGARPATGAKHPERTLEQYCVYDSAHKDYVYKAAFAEKVLEKISTREGFVELTGVEPVLKEGFAE